MNSEKIRKATLSEIKVWYKFKPTLDIWTSKVKGKSNCMLFIDESWYGGYWFYRGCFAFINLKITSIHIRFSWWKFNLTNAFKK